jgi:uncharacterized membrane protein
MYLLLKTVHVIAVVMFVGNIATGVFWKAHADRTRDPRLIAHALHGIIRSDRLFTVPGVLLIVAAGIAAAIVGELPILGTGWILWSIVLFSIAGIAFGARVAPLQRRMLSVANEGAGQEGRPMDWATYDRLSRDWAVWGALALLTPFAAIVLMVLKPVLPGL